MEKFFFKKIEMWVVLLLVILGMAGMIVFGAAVRSYHKGGKLGKIVPWVESIASLPTNAQILLRPKSFDLEAKENRFEGESGFTFNYRPGEREDLGYILANRYDADLEMTVSELVDLNTQEMVHQWRYNVDDIDTPYDKENNFKTKRFRAFHALLKEDGSIIANGIQVPLVTLDACSNLTLYSDEALFHHSIESDHEGGYWIPCQPLEDDEFNVERDCIAHLTADSSIDFKTYLEDIFIENGLTHLLYGGPAFYTDPFHLNDIEPIMSDGEFWKKGDLVLSIRNYSMIMNYRPETNKVIWYKRGPWMHQHDVDIIDNNTFAVFDNNMQFITPTQSVPSINGEYFYNLKDDSTTQDFADGFKKLDIRTATGGRGEMVNQNEIFVEETAFGRLVQFNRDGDITWQYINRASNGKTYLLSWSRLVSRELGDKVRKSVEETNCDAH